MSMKAMETNPKKQKQREKKKTVEDDDNLWQKQFSFQFLAPSSSSPVSNIMYMYIYTLSMWKWHIIIVNKTLSNSKYFDIFYSAFYFPYVHQTITEKNQLICTCITVLYKTTNLQLQMQTPTTAKIS